jgi:hypothetical protein
MKGLNWKTAAMAALSLIVALVSYRFLLLGLEHSFQGMDGHIAARPLAFTLHISAAPVALILGAIPFALPRLPFRAPGLHRWSGRIYALTIWVGGVAGLIMAMGAAEERPVAALGFGLLAVLWVGFTSHAVVEAMRRRIALHRRWMIRSFALTFAAVTLRLQLPVFFAAGMEYAEASSYIAWLCWVPNLLVAEWILWRDRSGRRAAAREVTARQAPARRTPA